MRDREDLEQRLSRQLHELAGLSNQLGHRYAAAAGLNATDLDGLLLIWQAQLAGEPITSSQLASQLEVTPAAASYLVDRLDKSGLLLRSPDPDDRRRVLLRPSESGTELGDGYLRPLGHGLRMIFSNRSDADLALFNSMLADLICAMPASHPKAGLK